MASMPDVCLFTSVSEADTDRLGRALARALVPGAVVALMGPLGAGKTRLVRAAAEAAGVDPRSVSSPTFVLVHEYEGRFPICHFDTYRLQDVQEFIDLGAAEYCAPPNVCFIEWADRVSLALPIDNVRVEITPTGESSREFRISAGGPQSAGVVAQLFKALNE